MNVSHVWHFITANWPMMSSLFFRSHRYFSSITFAPVGRSKIHKRRALSALKKPSSSSCLLVCNCEQNDLRKIFHQLLPPSCPAPKHPHINVIEQEKIFFVRARVSVNLIIKLLDEKNPKRIRGQISLSFYVFTLKTKKIATRWKFVKLTPTRFESHFWWESL